MRTIDKLDVARWCAAGMSVGIVVVLGTAGVAPWIMLCVIILVASCTTTGAVAALHTVERARLDRAADADRGTDGG